MTDLQIAKNNLEGHSICLCRDGQCIFSDERGIAPMMSFVAGGVNLAGYSVADKLVGKAVAMLFVKCGIKDIFAKKLSVDAKRWLSSRGITCEYEILVDKIINRAGTDICPMEQTVRDVDDVEEAYLLLKTKLQALNAR